MTNDPTIEEVAAAKAALSAVRGKFGVVSVPEDSLRTLLAYIASLEEGVKEAKRLMKPFAEAAENLDDTNDFDDDELWEHAAAMGLHVRDLRALAAFVNEKET